MFFSEINKKKYNKIDNNNLIDKSTNSYSGSLIKINNNFSSWNVWKMIVKRKFLIKNKIFFKNLFQFEDWVFIATIISKKPKYLLINKFVYSYRLTNFYSEGKKTSSRSLSNALKTCFYLIKINKKLKNKTIEKMITNIKIIIYIDLFALKKNKILKYKKKFPFLNHVFSKNLEVQNKIASIKINSLNKFILFCAGRFGRAISLKLRNINQEIKVIIDNNPDYHNLKINNFTVKNQTYLSKNYKIFKDYKILICHMNKKIFTSVTSNIVSSRLNKRMIVKINIV